MWTAVISTGFLPDAATARRSSHQYQKYSTFEGRRKEGEGENNNLFTVGDVDYVFCCDGYRDNNINIGLEAIKMELLLSASFGALAITGGVLTVVMAIDLLNQFRNR